MHLNLKHELKSFKVHYLKFNKHLVHLTFSTQFFDVKLSKENKTVFESLELPKFYVPTIKHSKTIKQLNRPFHVITLKC